MKRHESTFGHDPAVWVRAKEETLRTLREVAADRRTITYSDLASRVRAIALDARSPAMNHLLAEISTAEHHAGRGLITAIVVHKGGDGGPGPGFFALAESLRYEISNQTAFWTEMVERVFVANAPTRR